MKRPLPVSPAHPVLTEEQIAELRESLAAATPGPVCVHPNGTSLWCGIEYDRTGMEPGQDMLLKAGLPWTNERAEEFVNNLAFVADIWNAAPALLAMAASVGEMRELLREGRHLMMRPASCRLSSHLDSSCACSYCRIDAVLERKAE